MDNDEDEDNDMEKNIYKNIKVAAPGSSEETIASLKIMQQMQKSHTALAKKKIAEMEQEKKLTDERVKQLVRRLVEKDSKLKKQEETISYLKSELDYVRKDNYIGRLGQVILKTLQPLLKMGNRQSDGEKLGDRYDMIGLDEITGAIFAAKKSPELKFRSHKSLLRSLKSTRRLCGVGLD